jgi:hypothetical protein
MAIAACAASVDLEPPELEDADDALADEHRRPEHRAISAELPPDRKPVDGIGEDVGDLNDAALQPDAADERLRALRHRVTLHVVAVLGTAAEDEGDPVEVAIRLVDVAAVGAGQPHRMAHDRLEHGLEPEVGAPDHLEHLIGGGLLLVRLCEVREELRDPLVARDRRFRLGRHRNGPPVRLLGRR